MSLDFFMKKKRGKQWDRIILFIIYFLKNKIKNEFI